MLKRCLLFSLAALFLVACVSASESPVLNADREVELFRAGAVSPAILKLLKHKGDPKNIRPNGAMGRNARKFSDVAAQRDALWVIRYALGAKSKKRMSEAVRALSYGFDHQADRGYFENGHGYKPRKTLNADAFFLQSFGHAYALLDAADGWSEICDELDSFRSKVERAVRWLEENKKELWRQDRKTPNRLLFDALAFILSDRYLSRGGFHDTGEKFIQKALIGQNKDGSFIEHGGTDTSYQAVCLLNLCTLWFYLEDGPLRETVLQSATAAASWELSRIEASGKVAVKGNSRTGLGQEKFFGKKKDVNYPEVALALHTWGSISGDGRFLDAADRVVEYLEQSYLQKK